MNPPQTVFGSHLPLSPWLSTSVTKKAKTCSFLSITSSASPKQGAKSQRFLDVCHQLSAINQRLLMRLACYRNGSHQPKKAQSHQFRQSTCRLMTTPTLRHLQHSDT